MPPAHVQSKGASYGSAATHSVTFDSATTSGNTVVVAVTFYCTSGSIDAAVVTDNKGNVYAPLCFRTESDNTSIGVFYCTNITGGSSHQVTVKGQIELTDYNTYCSVAVSEVSGVNRAHRWVADGFASSSTPSSGSQTTTVADCILFALLTHDSGDQYSITPDTAGGWTERYEYDDPSTTQVMSWVSKVVSSASTYSHTWTLGTSLTGISAIVALCTVTPPTSSVYPLKASANGRYLTDKNDTPFLMLVGSPQGMILRSVADMHTWCSTRAAQGFNVAQVHVTACIGFGGNVYGSTYDTIYPFTRSSGDDYPPFVLGVPADVRTPNPVYFDRLDALLTEANDHGMTVILTAAEWIDSAVLFIDGTTAARYWNQDFGRWLGMRYRDWPNIIWAIGNDVQNWRTYGVYATCLAKVLEGIADVDANHLLTGWGDYNVSSSREPSSWEALVTLDLAYTYYADYFRIATSYALDPAKPIFMGESGYEGDSNPVYQTNALTIRQQNYWGTLAGALGGTSYCGDDEWGFPTGWEDNLDTTAANECIHWKNLFEDFNWWLLQSDDGSNTVLTAGYGTRGTWNSTAPTQTPGDTTYALAARASDGSVIIAYIPEPRTVTIDMSKITAASGQARCRWYDPTAGTYATIGTYSNSGTRDFTLDSGDKLLVIDAVAEEGTLDTYAKRASMIGYQRLWDVILPAPD